MTSTLLALVSHFSPVRLARRHSFIALSVLLATPAALVSTIRAADDDEITAVASKVSDDYVRAKRPDGSFEVETYAFGKGGFSSGGIVDETIDQTKFMDVARIISVPLQQQNYMPATDSNTTRLLIMVYWGTTNPPARQSETIEFQNASRAFANLQNSIMAGSGGASSASSAIKRATGQVRGGDDEENAASAALAAMEMQNRIRRRRDAENSRLLGYDSWWAATSHFEGTPLDTRRQDMLNELEEDRYFVVLMAYDFQLMWKQKKTKLLWETRFSISQRHHQFDRDLAAMAQYASKYFGQDSHGLIRKPLRSGVVELGELKNVGVEENEK